jgi:hypothetical protein
MNDPDLNNPGTAGPARRPGFGRLVRQALPASPLDWLIYAAFAVAMHFVLRFAWPTTLGITAATAAVPVLGTAALRYLAARRQPAGPDDGTVSGDG